MRVLGVDPGLRTTGYGVVDAVGGTFRLIEGGVLRPKPALPLEARLAQLHERYSRSCARRSPTAWSWKNCGRRPSIRRPQC